MRRLPEQRSSRYASATRSSVRYFVSLFAYAFGKQHYPNVEDAAARELEKGAASDVPAFRTLHNIRRMLDSGDELELHTDHSSLISRARDRAAGRFLRSSSDVWISLDDDTEAVLEACDFMLHGSELACRVTSAAMRVRKQGVDSYNVVPHDLTTTPGKVAEWEPGHLYVVQRAGCGFVRADRAPVERIARHFTMFQWDEPDPLDERKLATSPGIFLPMIRNRTWLDDDFAFSERARMASVPIWSVLLPGISHAGLPNPVSEGAAMKQGELRCQNCGRVQAWGPPNGLTDEEANAVGWRHVVRHRPGEKPDVHQARLLCPFCSPLRATS